MKTIALEQIQIAERCTESWEAMPGDERRRYCDKCRKHVHNISAMPRGAATELIAGDHVCIRMQRDFAGRVVTADETRWTQLRARLQRTAGRILPAFLLSAMSLLWNACTRQTVAGAIMPQPNSTTQPAGDRLGKVAAPPPLGAPPPLMGTPRPPATQPATQPKIARAS